MTVDQHELYVSSAEQIAESPLRRLLRELSPADILVSSYLLFLNLAVLVSPASPDRSIGLVQVMSLLFVQVATVVAIRSRALTHPYMAPLAYRLVTYGGVQITYFMFATLLPVINPNAFDHRLYALDLMLFGVEPAEYFDRFVNASTTEWFAFFYFSYFFVLALHVLPILFSVRNARLLNEFALGMLIMFCAGHTLYILVPGYGPYKAMPEIFQHQLTPGIFWNMTTDLVAEGGAQKDIFPSLHTAAPTFILLFSFHRRRMLPFRYTWPIVGFFAANIVIATMFLRWHYVIDVIAGLLLAVTAHTLGTRISDWELERRRVQGLREAWPRWP